MPNQPFHRKACAMLLVLGCPLLIAELCAVAQAQKNAPKSNSSPKNAPAAATKKNELHPPVRYKDNKIVRKPEPEAPVIEPFKPKPIGSPDERLQKAKVFLEDARQGQKEWVLKELSKRVKGRTEVLEEYKKSPDAGSKAKKAAIENRSKELQEATDIKEKFEKEGVLPRTSKIYQPFELDGFRRPLAADRFELPLARVRLAYSDVIRERRKKNDLAGVRQLEDEASAFLKNAGHQIKGPVETWRELQGYDLEQVTGWIEGRVRYPGIPFERQIEWTKERISEGLSLPPEAASAPLWKELADYLPQRLAILGKLNPLQDANVLATFSFGLSALEFGLAGTSGQKLVGYDVNGNPQYETDYEALEMAAEQRGRALNTAQESGGLIRDSAKQIGLLEAELRRASRPLQSQRETYLRRRATQLQLPTASDRLSFSVSGNRVVVTNNSDEELHDVEILVQADAISQVPKDLPERVKIATQKKLSADLNVGNMRLNQTRAKKEQQEAKAKLDELKAAEVKLRSPLNSQYVVTIPANGKVTIYEGDFANVRDLKLLAVCKSFLSEHTFVPPANAAKSKVKK